MTKIVTFTVRPEDDVLSQFADTYRALRAGRRVARHDGVSFTSIEAVRNFLTPARISLLRAVRRRRPGSAYALAKMVGRDPKNVQQDLKILGQHGLVTMQHPLHADVLIDFRPVETLSRPDQAELRALRRCRVGKPPRPG